LTVETESKLKITAQFFRSEIRINLEKLTQPVKVSPITKDNNKL